MPRLVKAAAGVRGLALPSGKVLSANQTSVVSDADWTLLSGTPGMVGGLLLDQGASTAEPDTANLGGGVATDVEVARIIAAERAHAKATFAPAGDALRPLRAACIGTSIYANGLRAVDNVTVQIGNTWGPMDASGMQQASAGSWFTWLCLLSGGRIVHHYNAGISSDRLDNMAARFAADVVAKRPDVVFLGDATNDINNDVSDSLIRGYVDSMVRAARAAGIAPILTATTRRNDTYAKNLRVREHNLWLQRYAWANRLPFIDPFAVLVDPANANGNVLTSLVPDGLHPNHAGAKAAGQKALDDLAGILRGNTTPSRSPLLPQDRTGGPNLWQNGLALDDVNADGKADSWAFGATGGTFSLVTDATVLGKAQQVVVGSASPWIGYQPSVDGVNVREGDRLAWSGMAKADAAAGNLQWKLQIGKLGGTGAYDVCPIGYSAGGAVGMDLPWSPFYCEIVVPIGATALRAGMFSQTGTGTMSLAQQQIINLTKLGIA